MTDLSQSIILPREDYYELLASANHESTPATFKQRAGTTLFVLAISSILSGAYAFAAWSHQRAVEKLEAARHENRMAEKSFEFNATFPPPQQD